MLVVCNYHRGIPVLWLQDRSNSTIPQQRSLTTPSDVLLMFSSTTRCGGVNWKFSDFRDKFAMTVAKIFLWSWVMLVNLLLSCQSTFRCLLTDKRDCDLSLSIINKNRYVTYIAAIKVFLIRGFKFFICYGYFEIVRKTTAPINNERHFYEWLLECDRIFSRHWVNYHIIVEH